jgi:hypothetical protein
MHSSWLEEKPTAKLRRQIRARLFVIPGSRERISETFKEHVERWHKDTLALSSIPEKINHPSYLKIIALGKAAIPLILEELRARPTYWFAALEALTDDGPIGPFKRFDNQRAAWLKWGIAHGLIAGLHSGPVSVLPKARRRKSRA